MCLVVCAQMIGECFGKSYTQGEIVEEIKGESVNEGGTLEELADAIKFTSKCSTKILKDTISFSKVKSEIRDSNPFAIRIFFDWEWRQHAVVGADMTMNQRTNLCIFLIRGRVARSITHMKLCQMEQNLTAYLVHGQALLH